MRTVRVPSWRMIPSRANARRRRLRLSDVVPSRAATSTHGSGIRTRAPAPSDGPSGEARSSSAAKRWVTSRKARSAIVCSAYASRCASASTSRIAASG